MAERRLAASVEALPLSPTIGAMIRIASVCLFVYWLAIFIATHLPRTALPHVQGSDKVHHALAFSGLAFLLAWAIPTSGQMLRHLCVVASIGLCYGCLDELTQLLIPGRHCDVQDIAADFVGVCCGIVAYVIFRRILCSLSWGKRLIQILSR